MADIVLIKKYANRRLYDTEKSTYISLNDLTEMIREGRQAKVIEANTKEDVTAFILTQIILEEAKKKNTLLPVPLLSLIIQYGENVLAEFFEKYLFQIIKTYIRYRKAFDDQFKNWLELGWDLPSTSFWDFFPTPVDTTKNLKSKKKRK
jgi:polyhydroxyalkanoate synthesis repressor PhaR